MEKILFYIKFLFVMSSNSSKTASLILKLIIAVASAIAGALGFQTLS